MKNKIIAGVIAILFLPAVLAMRWAIEQFLLVRIVLGIVLMLIVIIMVYKFSKLVLDEHSKNNYCCPIKLIYNTNICLDY